MAGQYPDVPGVRIPYHVDGSLVKVATSDASAVITGTWTNISNNDVASLNDGNSATGWAPNVTSHHILSFALPYSVQFTGHNLILNATQPAHNAIDNLYYSKDTTDGTDGTWTSIAHEADTNYTSAVSLRSFTSVNIVDVKGFRVLFRRQTLYELSLIDIAFYGLWTPTTLAAWHPTQDQQINGAHLDFGNILLGTTPAARQFRIKNGTGSTANSVLVSVPVGAPNIVANLKFSLDGSTYTSSVTIPTIVSGGISPPIYVRRTVLAGEVPNSVGSVPIVFTASSWS
jgi:hypothetical protein